MQEKNRNTSISGESTIALSYVNTLLKLSLSEIAKANQDSIIYFDSLKYDYRDSSVLVYDHVNDSMLYFNDTLLLDEDASDYDALFFDTTQYFSQADTIYYKSNDLCKYTRLITDDRMLPIRGMQTTYEPCYTQESHLWQYEGSFYSNQNLGVDSVSSSLSLECNQFKVNQLSTDVIIYVENIGLSSDSNTFLRLSVKIADALFMHNASSFTWSADLTYELRAGFSTPYNTSDDQWRIYGAMTGISSDGEYFVGTISNTTPLRYASNCNWITAGKINLKVTDRIDRRIDFGTFGQCNNEGSVHINKKPNHLILY